MNEDKITISMDEVDRATPVPGSTPAPFFTPRPVSFEPDRSPRKRTGLKVGIVIAVVAVLVIVGIGIAAAILSGDERSNGQVGKNPPPAPPPVRTVDDIRQELIAEAESECGKPSSPLRQRVEQAHQTVTVTSVKVVRCEISTRDGSNSAGDNDSNVSAIEVLLRFYWEGFIDNGYTDLKITHDAVNDRTECVMDYTTAAINLEDPDFWFDLGLFIGFL